MATASPRPLGVCKPAVDENPIAIDVCGEVAGETQRGVRYLLELSKPPTGIASKSITRTCCARRVRLSATHTNTAIPYRSDREIKLFLPVVYICQWEWSGKRS